MSNVTAMPGLEAVNEARPRDQQRRLVLVGLDEELSSAVDGVLRRVAPNAAAAAVPKLEEVDPAVLADPGTVIVLRCQGPEDPALAALRSLRQRGARTPAILLLATAAAAAGAAFRDLGSVDLLPEEGFTAFDLHRALFNLAATAQIEERALELESRLQESERGRYHLRRRLQQLSHQLALLEIDDELTGWRTASTVLARMEEETRRARLYQVPVACLLLSIEDFQAIRHRFDPDFADFVLVRVAYRLKRALRSSDLLARYGDHQFVVLSPFTTAQGALSMAGRLKQAVVSEQVRRDPHSLAVSVSVGLAFLAEGMKGARDLISAAARSLEASRPAASAAIEAA
jgi:diguanylate cyclase (GGDEF)-like protein